MRYLLPVLFALALPGLGQSAPLPSAIEAVTVYQDRAVVSRQASVELPAGEHELVLDKLPATLQDNSVQVAARSNGQATLLDVKTGTVLLAERSNDRLKAIDEQVRQLQARLASLDDEAAVLENQREWVGLVQRGAAEPARDGSRLTLEQLNNIQAASADTLARALAGLRRIAAQREIGQRELEVLQASQQQVRGELGRQSKAVTLRLKLARAGKVDIGLSYAVPGARWTPAYDVRLGKNDGHVDLAYFGVVRQNTGEDWNKVKLTLSTARPALGGAAPTQTPWVLDAAAPPALVPPAPLAAVRYDAKARPQAGLAADEAVAAAEIAQAGVRNEQTSASFVIDSPATLPSGSATQRVAITSASLPAELQYQAVPALRETMYLTAKVNNGTDYPLLAGALNSFLGDAFLATSTIPTVMPGEKLDLALGADDGVSVKRILLDRKTESTGFSGNGRRQTYEYEFRVKNNKASEVHVAFSDRLPVSRHEKIVVKLLSSSDAEKGDEGKLTWNWTLKPGQSREARLKFSIDYPGDMTVSGL
ncbi:mucoidy inhibitor MuiA family protein [Bordetella genomosp. 12]|uniref:Mucoidy inhibitor MuiA family protein n=1 Tax=Bordetella genomosp. 12 TaxID=463035 RepID=A0A261VC72_9BORD|nr:mucoidy inhibitor MuiA family protein [Bordetella genomosp. 12]OZI71381.1 hypothetical protein CAL22_16235 [Bordetella genomosp. 12]